MILVEGYSLSFCIILFGCGALACSLLSSFWD